MQDLFYFPQDQTLCWVAGYTADGNTDNVEAMIRDLKKNAETFADVAGVAFPAINTAYITKSRRYKNMRIFYVKTAAPPIEAFVFDNWKLWDYIHD